LSLEKPMKHQWLIFQIVDSAFPTGGFAHSAGLEAAVQLGEITDGPGLQRFIRASAWQNGHGALPFLTRGFDAPEDLGATDALCDAFLTGSIANRASRTQGRAFIGTCARIFDHEPILRLDSLARDRLLSAHFAPLFGATLRALNVGRKDAQSVYLHLALRGLTSAAIRLGVVGPHEAQRIAHAHAPTLDAVLEACADLSLDNIAQPAPLLELMGQTHDRLYSKLFQS
jgi:urease accessory protein